MATRTTMYVIFAGPQQHGRSGTRYIAKDGTKTDLRTNAAKFYLLEDAKAFTKNMSITLTENTYIGQEDFTDFEIQHDA
jgi:hypothetical protein